MKFNFFKKILLIIVLLVPNCFLYNKIDNSLLIITNFILMLLIAFGIITSKIYSLNTIFYLFFFIFIGIVPLNDYINKNSYWGGALPSVNSYIETNILFILILLIYKIFYDLIYKLEFSKSNLFCINKFKDKELKKIDALILCSLIYVFYLSCLNWDLLAPFFRNKTESIGAASQIRGSIINTFIRPMIMYCFWNCMVYIKEYTPKNLFFILIILIITILGIPLTGMARFQAAAMYFPIFLISFNCFKKYFKLILITGLFYIFPFLDLFRNYDEKIGIKFKYSLDFLNHGHFDSYQNFLRLIDSGIITNGRQLLGTLFSYIPRSLWQNKPIGSGAYLAKQINLEFSNISMNYFGEGFINFGYLGILAFTIVISYINANIDKIYWEKLNFFHEKKTFEMYYFLMIMLEFFILRGDLMSSLTYTVAMVISLYIVNSIILKNISNLESVD